MNRPLEAFSGFAPLFPLPKLKLFPHTRAAYHIFEPRYRKMLAAALEGEQLIAMALLKPAYEHAHYGNPPYREMGCLGRIISHEELDDGNANIVLEGLVRVGFGELVKETPFRVAKLELLPERDRGEDFTDLQHALIQKLIYIVKISKESVDLSYLYDPDTRFASVVNMIAIHLPIKPGDHYNLLKEDSLKNRAEKVAWYLDDHTETLELLEKVGPLPPDSQFLN